VAHPALWFPVHLLDYLGQVAFGVGIVVMQRFFVLLTGQRSTLAVVASTLLIAGLFTPLRRRIQFRQTQG
jgi:hypothetical protein